MATTNRKIHEFFKPKPPSAKPVASQPSIWRAAEGPSNHTIKSSDDEETNSDTSFEDLADLLQFKSSKTTVSYQGNNCPKPSKATRSKDGRKYAASPASPIAAKPKYQFDLKKLVSQAEMANATEESAIRVKAMLDGDLDMESTSPSSNNPDTHRRILGSFTAEEEGAKMEKVLQAVKRTEATHAERRWYFFNSCEENRFSASPLLASKELDWWQRNIVDPQLREQLILSGFARDMITLKDVFPDEFFLWILDEICLEKRSDLREAYCNTLTASEEQISRLIHPETIAHIFRNLGAKETSVDLYQEILPAPENMSAYKGQDCAILRTVISFIGNISRHLSEVTRSYAISILARLCADSVVLENIGLLVAIRRAIEQVSQSIAGMFWSETSREISNSVYSTINDAVLRFQILRCIPQTTPRLHELRRRLALAFFFSDMEYAIRSPPDYMDLWDITKRLNGPQFKIRKDTDYRELAALISILDIAIDNGQSAENDMTDPGVERDFNTDVDDLADRIKIIWSTINDAGASFISRIDAKEVMEGLRNRLIYGVRTKLKPKQSIFDSTPDNSESVRKQSAMMSKYFKRDQDRLTMS